jgi:hypothetical protein
MLSPCKAASQSSTAHITPNDTSSFENPSKLCRFLRKSFVLSSTISEFHQHATIELLPAQSVLASPEAIRIPVKRAHADRGARFIAEASVLGWIWCLSLICRYVIGAAILHAECNFSEKLAHDDGRLCIRLDADACANGIFYAR